MLLPTLALIAASFVRPYPSLAPAHSHVTSCVPIRPFSPRASELQALTPEEPTPSGDVEDKGYPGREVVRKVLDVVFVIQSAFFQILGGGLALGLVLNLCGFGYAFTDEGLIVKPLAEFRQAAADRRFTRDAARSVEAPLPVDELKRLRGGAVRADAGADAGAVARPGRMRRARKWLRTHLETCVHAAMCLWTMRDAVQSVRDDQWVAVRLSDKVVKQRADSTLERRRRSAKVTQLLGAGYTPRIVFLAGMMLRSLQMSTGARRIFDPSFGYAAGACVAASYAQREWLPCILLGWGTGGLYWSAFGVRPPGVAKDAVGWTVY